jgi:hypothetical protein
MIPLAVIVVVLVGGVALTVLYFKFAAGKIRASEPYQHALAKALANERVIKVLGEPVAAGKLATGDLHVRDDGSGDADFQMNLVGKWRSAMIHVVAKRSGGTWTYSEMSFLPWGGGDGIDLTYEGPTSAPVR